MKPLTRLKLNHAPRPIEVLSYWKKENILYLSPPYQRGDVWGPMRQKNLIRSLLIGVPIPVIIFNDRYDAGWGEEMAVIDGKQRITTFIKFLEDDLCIPGEWVGTHKEEIVFSDLPKSEQRRIRHHTINVSEGCLESLEEEKEVFDLINFGGVPQGESDIPK
jgi:hypothetical protein